MNSTLPGPVRALIAANYRGAVHRVDPGMLKSNDCKRDLDFLMHCSDRWLLVGLPAYGKLFDATLAAGSEDAFTFGTLPDGWTEPLPERFCRPILEGVRRFDPSCVRALRQILHLLSKLEWDSDKELEDAAIASFLQRNESVRTISINEEVARRARLPWFLVLGNVDWRDIYPRHGSGSVATAEKPWEKMNFRRMYRSAELYPPDLYYFLDLDHLAARYTDMDHWSMHEYPVTRLCCVPKDFRGPRLISAEPLEIMWLQQGQRLLMYETIERAPLTRGLVNFTSSEVNRQLARSSSVDGKYATLDLKDASDWVSYNLVRSIADESSFQYLSATRSRATVLPNGQEVSLGMFSPMGSAVCFPIESLVFFSCIMGAAHAALYPGRPATRKSLMSLRGVVAVYGDDIIVRSDLSDLAMRTLLDVGLKPNKAKCCTGPRFRESCGLDAYIGVDVSPVRIKRLPCRQDPTSLTASCDYINRFKDAQMEMVAQHLLCWTEGEFGTRLPRSSYPIPGTIRVGSWTSAVCENASLPNRFNRRLQQREYHTLCVTPLYHHVREPDQWSELFYSLTVGCRDGGRRHTVPHRVRLTKRWMVL